MNTIVHPSRIEGTIRVVSSKSYAHRQIIAAALSDGMVRFDESNDVNATINSLFALGFCGRVNEGCVQFNGYKKPKGVVDVDCGESGSTFRFILPLAAALGVHSHFILRGKLGDRPIKALADSLSEHGSIWNDETKELTGKLVAGRYIIDRSESSQFVTGLLLALPLLDGDSEIITEGKEVSRPYIDITLDVLSQSGIKIEERKDGFYILGKQKYLKPNINVVGDWSGAAAFAICGAMGNVQIQGISLEDKQGDKAVLDVLNQVGAVVSNGNGIRVKKGSLKGFVFDLTAAPDLAPVLAALAAFCEGESKLFNVDRLKAKESDRLEGIMNILETAGVHSELIGNTLLIKPTGEIKEGTFEGRNDHRLVMMGTIIATFGNGGKITCSEAVAKSYPNFWQDMRSIGAEYGMER